MGKFLSQYKNILEANESNQNCYGLWEYRLLQNFIQKLNILPHVSQYKLSILMFVVNNRDQFLINSEIHNINTRHNSNLHLS